MVFSDDFLHFLKIKKTFVEFTREVDQNYLVALTLYLLRIRRAFTPYRAERISF